MKQKSGLGRRCVIRGTGLSGRQAGLLAGWGVCSLSPEPGAAPPALAAELRWADRQAKPLHLDPGTACGGWTAACEWGFLPRPPGALAWQPARVGSLAAAAAENPGQQLDSRLAPLFFLAEDY